MSRKNELRWARYQWARTQGMGPREALAAAQSILSLVRAFPDAREGMASEGRFGYAKRRLLRAKR